MNNNIELIGNLNVTLTDGQGNIKETRHVQNKIVETGTFLIADLLAANFDAASAPIPPCAMAVGTYNQNNTSSSATPTIPPAVSITDTKLEYEIDRVSDSTCWTIDHGVTSVGGSPTPYVSNVIKYTGEFNPSSKTGYICEAGIFNNTVQATPGSASGIMLNRATFNPVYKETGDKLTIQWTVTINASAT